MQYFAHCYQVTAAHFGISQRHTIKPSHAIGRIIYVDPCLDPKKSITYVNKQRCQEIIELIRANDHRRLNGEGVPFENEYFFIKNTKKFEQAVQQRLQDNSTHCRW